MKRNSSSLTPEEEPVINRSHTILEIRKRAYFINLYFNNLANNFNFFDNKFLLAKCSDKFLKKLETYLNGIYIQEVDFRNTLITQSSDMHNELRIDLTKYIPALPAEDSDEECYADDEDENDDEDGFSPLRPSPPTPPTPPTPPIPNSPEDKK